MYSHMRKNRIRIADLTDEEKELFLSELNVDEPGLNLIIRKTYTLLNLQTYFTAGVKYEHGQLKMVTRHRNLPE